MRLAVAVRRELDDEVVPDLVGGEGLGVAPGGHSLLEALALPDDHQHVAVGQQLDLHTAGLRSVRASRSRASRGKGGGEELAYYKGGFAQLARDIGDHVGKAGGKVMLGAEALAISNRDGIVEVETSAGVIRGRTSLVTTPLPHAAKILEGGSSVAYAQSLNRIRYLGNVCLVLEMTRSLSELYWLNVNDPSFPYVGIIEHTNFEPRESYGGRHIVYLSKYLPVSDALYQMTPEQVFEYSLPYIQRMFPEFDRSWVTRHHVWRAPYAQPIVEKHYSRLIPDVRTPIDGVFLSTMAQVYPEDRGTNYAVREGGKIAQLIVKDLDGRTPANHASGSAAETIRMAS